MSKSKILNLTRRDVLKTTGALVITLAAPAGLARKALSATGGKPPAFSPTQLDSYLAVTPDNKVAVYFGKMDMGQGVDTAIGQIVADELDVPFEAVTVVMGDTAHTLDQGGGSNSSAIKQGAVPLRNAAAEARRILLDLAAKQLKASVDSLMVIDGVISVRSNPAKKVSYGELIGGKYFDVPMQWNKRYGNALKAWGKAEPKKPGEYKIVGKSIPPIEVPDKLFGKTTFVTDVRVPGMMHGRVVRPKVAGVVPVKVDKASIKSIPGAQIVWEKDFLGVVAENEWGAIKAAEQLEVTWTKVKPPFPRMEDLYDYMRKTPHVAQNAGSGFGPKKPVIEGPFNQAIAGAARVIEAEYEYPFQSHASMGPACAVADVQKDSAMVWTGSQKAHAARDGVAKLLNLPKDKVHAIWYPGPGSYGRNDAGDAVMDAAILSKAVGRPVRVQGMRFEGHAWDPKGPAGIVNMRAGLDAGGNVIAYRYAAKGFSAWGVSSSEKHPRDTYAGQLTGWDKKPRYNFGIPSESYDFAAKLTFWQAIPQFENRASPMRTSHFRDPQGPQIHFASESFIDDIAAATNTDPVEFRLRYIKKKRDKETVKAAAEAAGWDTRPSPKKNRDTGEILTGRGISYATRGGTIVAMVAEVEVNRNSGRVWVKRMVCAHDCGLVINPDGLKKTIEGNIIMGMSRTLFEEVEFEPEMVTSVDWATYPILESTDAPEAIDVVLINRPNIAPSGSGEPATRPVPAAIANAIFDATGERIRRVPFTPERVKALLG